MGLSDKDLEALGLKPTAKMAFVLIGERLFHRVDGGWEEYERKPISGHENGADKSGLESRA